MANATITKSAVSLNVNPSTPTGPVLKMVNGRPMVSSLEVADHFGKRHDHLLRSIQSIIRNAPESFGAPNFGETYIDVPMPNGGGFKKSLTYDLTRDGFVIVAMGFTGKKAIEWKINYIMAFNAMEAEIAGQAAKAIPATLPISTTADRAPLRALCAEWARKMAAPNPATQDHHRAASLQLKANFQLDTIKQLPAAWIPDAVAWLQSKIDGLTALPSAEPVPPLPEASTPEPLPADLGMRLHRMRAIKHEMQDISADIYLAVKRSIRPKFTEYGRPAFSLLVNMNETAQSVLYALDRDLDALEHLCTSGILAGRVFAGDIE